MSAQLAIGFAMLLQTAGVPRESTTVPLKNAVLRVLASPVEIASDTRELVGKLEQLGPDALPILTDVARHENGWPLALAAMRLGAAEYRPAAGILASRLVRDDSSTTRDTVDLALLEALTRIAGDSETGALARALEDASRTEWTRFHAFIALANIGSPDAVAAVDRSVTARRVSHARGAFAPSAQDFLELIGQPTDEAARQRAAEREDYEEWARLGRGASAARVLLASGDSAVVFRDGQLGRDADLWLEEFDGRGRPKGPAIFLGVGSPCKYDPCPIGVAATDTGLIIRRPGETVPPLAVDLDAVRRDTDGDGLTDLVERRLDTTPTLADSDGDEIPDGEDPFPNAAVTASGAERDRVTADIFEQFHLFDESSRELAVLIGAVAPARTGRIGPTLLLDHKRAKQFKAKDALDSLPLITIEPAGRTGQTAAFAGTSPVVSLGPADRAYDLTIYRGPLHAVGYRVTVRQHGGRWFIRHFVQVWIS